MKIERAKLGPCAICGREISENRKGYSCWSREDPGCSFLEIAPAQGKLGILLVGLGAVSTTTIAGVLAVRKGLAKPIGSLTQMGTVRLGKRTDGRSPRISDFVPLVALDNIVFGGWDIFEETSYEAARTAGVLEPSLLDQIKPELEAIKPMTAVFDQRYVKRLNGPNVKKGKNKKDLAEQVARRHPQVQGGQRLRSDGDGLVRQHRNLHDRTAAHQSIEAFEKALEENDADDPSSMVYAYAALMEGIPYANARAEPDRRRPALLVDSRSENRLAACRQRPQDGPDAGSRRSSPRA